MGCGAIDGVLVFAYEVTDQVLARRGVEESAQQLEMFAESDEKRRRLAGVLDQLNRSGRAAVVQHGHQDG